MEFQITKNGQEKKDQVGIQNDLTNIQGKRKEQEDEDINNNDDFTFCICV